MSFVCRPSPSAQSQRAKAVTIDPACVPLTPNACKHVFLLEYFLMWQLVVVMNAYPAHTEFL
jgi:hypothetical protein